MYIDGTNFILSPSRIVFMISSLGNKTYLLSILNSTPSGANDCN